METAGWRLASGGCGGEEFILSPCYRPSCKEIGISTAGVQSANDYKGNVEQTGYWVAYNHQPSPVT